ncbi:hypothetical protein GQ42DRAFT_161501 [Ramicandelaber brevisporus]|nr:hypothetical protein GQ42DRAFT_161501 [Ramicandelaber brevisporus]
MSESPSLLSSTTPRKRPPPFVQRSLTSTRSSAASPAPTSATTAAATTATSTVNGGINSKASTAASAATAAAAPGSSTMQRSQTTKPNTTTPRLPTSNTPAANMARNSTSTSSTLANRRFSYTGSSQQPQHQLPPRSPTPTSPALSKGASPAGIIPSRPGSRLGYSSNTIGPIASTSVARQRPSISGSTFVPPSPSSTATTRPTTPSPSPSSQSQSQRRTTGGNGTLGRANSISGPSTGLFVTLNRSRTSISRAASPDDNLQYDENDDGDNDDDNGDNNISMSSPTTQLFIRTGQNINVTTPQHLSHTVETPTETRADSVPFNVTSPLQISPQTAALRRVSSMHIPVNGSPTKQPSGTANNSNGNSRQTANAKALEMVIKLERENRQLREQLTKLETDHATTLSTHEETTKSLRENIRRLEGDLHSTKLELQESLEARRLSEIESNNNVEKLKREMAQNISNMEERHKEEIKTQIDTALQEVIGAMKIQFEEFVTRINEAENTRDEAMNAAKELAKLLDEREKELDEFELEKNEKEFYKIKCEELAQQLGYVQSELEDAIWKNRMKLTPLSSPKVQSTSNLHSHHSNLMLMPHNIPLHGAPINTLPPSVILPTNSLASRMSSMDSLRSSNNNSSSIHMNNNNNNNNLGIQQSPSAASVVTDWSTLVNRTPSGIGSPNNQQSVPSTVEAIKTHTMTAQTNSQQTVTSSEVSASKPASNGTLFGRLLAPVAAVEQLIVSTFGGTAGLKDDEIDEETEQFLANMEKLPMEELRSSKRIRAHSMAYTKPDVNMDNDIDNDNEDGYSQAGSGSNLESGSNDETDSGGSPDIRRQRPFPDGSWRPFRRRRNNNERRSGRRIKRSSSGRAAGNAHDGDAIPSRTSSVYSSSRNNSQSSLQSSSSSSQIRKKMENGKVPNIKEIGNTVRNRSVQSDQSDQSDQSESGFESGSESESGSEQSDYTDSASRTKERRTRNNAQYNGHSKETNSELSSEEEYYRESKVTGGSTVPFPSLPSDGDGDNDSDNDNSEYESQSDYSDAHSVAVDEDGYLTDCSSNSDYTDDSLSYSDFDSFSGYSHSFDDEDDSESMYSYSTYNSECSCSECETNDIYTDSINSHSDSFITATSDDMGGADSSAMSGGSTRQSLRRRKLRRLHNSHHHRNHHQQHHRRLSSISATSTAVLRSDDDPLASPISSSSNGNYDTPDMMPVQNASDATLISPATLAMDGYPFLDDSSSQQNQHQHQQIINQRRTSTSKRSLRHKLALEDDQDNDEEPNNYGKLDFGYAVPSFLGFILHGLVATAHDQNVTFLIRWPLRLWIAMFLAVRFIINVTVAVVIVLLFEGTDSPRTKHLI